MLKIGINITSFNRKEFTEQCIKSFLWSKAEDIEICLVDNGSTDGTREMLLDYQNKYDIIKHVILNKDNLYIGAAIRQGWSLLSQTCPLLGCMNNDYLVEPGWEGNVRACFEELKLDYIVGSVKVPFHPVIDTSSGKGHYTLTEGAGAGYFIRTEHFSKGFFPSTRPFSLGYVGPGPSWHKTLRRNFKGFRLASPGVIVRKSEYLKPEYVEYYNQTFGVRGRENQLEKFRSMGKGMSRGWMDWDTFLKIYYPRKVE